MDSDDLYTAIKKSFYITWMFFITFFLTCFSYAIILALNTDANNVECKVITQTIDEDNLFKIGILSV